MNVLLYFNCLFYYGVLSALHGDWLTFAEYWTGN